MSFLPFWVTEIRSNAGKMETDWYIYTETGVCTIPYLHTHKWAFKTSFTRCYTHTFIPSFFPPMSELSLFSTINQEEKKISIWFKWHRRVWFSLFICSQKLEKNNKLHLTLNYIKSEIVETIWPHCAWNVYAGFSVHLSVWSSLKIILHALVSFQWFSVCLHSRRRKEEVAGATVSLLSLLVAISPLPPSFSQCSNIRI